MTVAGDWTALGDCRAVLVDGTLILENSRVRRLYAWNEGHLVGQQIVDRVRNHTWDLDGVAPDLEVPGLALPGKEIEPTGGDLVVTPRPATALKPAYLQADVTTRLGPLQVRRSFRLYPDCPALACDLYLRKSLDGSENAPQGSPDSASRGLHPTLVDDPRPPGLTGTELDRLSESIIERLCIPLLHLAMVAWRFSFPRPLRLRCTSAMDDPGGLPACVFYVSRRGRIAVSLAIYGWLFLLVALLLAGCVTMPKRPGSPEYWPTESWRTSTPEAQGMDSLRLADMLAEIEARGYAIDSVSIVRTGTLVLDAYVHPYGPEQQHAIHSCTKSIVSALVGIAIEEGHIEGVEQPLLDFFPGRPVARLEARKEAIALEHILTMSSGLLCRDSYLYRWRGIQEMRRSGDWVQYVLDLPMAEEPGTHFEYCNGGSFLLSAIVQEATGQIALDYAQEHLFGPLGISDVTWPANPQGISIGWGEIWMRPHDMLKIGYLYLNEGRWEGEQIVPAEWVAASTRKHMDGTLQDGYGYQWWVADGGVYMALGYGGQYVLVAPELDMVVVFTSELAEQDFYLPQQLFERYIRLAAESSGPLPENAEGVARLRSYVEDLASP